MRKRKRDSRSCRHGKHKPYSYKTKFLLWNLRRGTPEYWICSICGRVKHIGESKWKQER